MSLPIPVKLLLAAALSCAMLSGCSNDSTDSNTDSSTNSSTGEDTDSTISAVDVDPTLFVDGALTEEFTTEDCTLSNGTETTCYRITIAGSPADNSAVGPYCPPSIDSTAEEGGTWIKDNEIYDVDGDFIVGLSTFYNDESWKMYDGETRAVTIIDGAYGCEVAGNPENTTGTDNFCLECNLEFIDGGVERTMLIPVTPVFEGAADANFGNDNIGIALNGVLLGPPAPLELIVSSLTLGVFDDCGGHANPHEGYHYHAANGCSEIGGQSDGHSAMIGYALDGYGVFARLDEEGNEPTGLDQCGGVTDDIRGYHYHASVPGANQIIGCFMGAKGYDDNGDEGGPGGPPPE